MDIRNGFIISHTSMTDVLALIKAFRVNARSVLLADFHKRIAKRIANNIDDRTTRLVENTPGSPYWDSYNEINGRHQKAQQLRVEDLEYDYNFAVELYPIKGDTTDIIIGRYRATGWGKLVASLWKNQAEISNYRWWDENGGPKPDGVSQAEWDERGIAWGKTDIDEAPPDESGFVSHVFGTSPLPAPTIAMVKAETDQITMNERAKRQAFEHFVKRRIEIFLPRGQSVEAIRALAQLIFDNDVDGEIETSYDTKAIPLMQITSDLIQTGPPSQLS